MEKNNIDTVMFDVIKVKKEINEASFNCVAYATMALFFGVSAALISGTDIESRSIITLCNVICSNIFTGSSVNSYNLAKEKKKILTIDK